MALEALLEMAVRAAKAVRAGNIHKQALPENTDQSERMLVRPENQVPGWDFQASLRST
uniref:hypothetical protein n=1 Tax=Leptospirillum ferrooxidans TaxID=180 RepID=UPI001568D587|nr:hypothetical protein [Leptospirillum ferrooxidans]